ncbi:MAG TPA: ThuA domain-containing protein [Verrucomicrobiae bacterium]|nr:ThuA domain-containing protein [Verrucomicrobiae bacterium]
MSAKINVTIWNEFRHEKKNEAVRKIYPDGMHVAIAKGLSKEKDLACRTATLDEPEHGLTEKVLSETDVLVWWGHVAHEEVKDEIVERVQQQVLSGMGLVALHSSHLSKIFRALMGTNCMLRWREADEKERIWNVAPGHPITEGIGEHFELPYEEMYGERFDIPEPDKLIFISWFEGGEVFRSGCCWERGNGRVFYFRPGHEAYPTYYDVNVIRVIGNACRWAARRVTMPTNKTKNPPAIEPIKKKDMQFGGAGVKQ